MNLKHFTLLALITLAGCGEKKKSSPAAGGNTCSDCSFKVFVTSTTTAGNFGGLAGGDTICNARASAAGLSGTYVAILSTSTVDAKDRFDASSVIKNVNDEIVANDEADFLDGTLTNAIDHDEFGNLRSAVQVWTGTSANGTRGSDHCSNWSSSTSNGTNGESHLTTFHFNVNGSDFCGGLMHLYCISTTVQP